MESWRKFGSSFDVIKVGSFGLLVLSNPYLPTSGINTELDKRALLMDLIITKKCLSFCGPDQGKFADYHFNLDLM